MSYYDIIAENVLDSHPANKGTDFAWISKWSLEESNAMDKLEVGPVSSKFLTYEEAVLYCTFCEHGGYTDWRLPTWAEYCYLPSLIGWYELPSAPIPAYQLSTSRVVFPVRRT